jgi:hypothetical protein
MLYLTTAAVLGALVVRLTRRHRLSELPHLRAAPMALGAWLLQLAVLASPLSAALAPLAMPIQALSLILIGLVVFANRRAPGVSLLALGLALNVVVMAVNAGYMPVSPAALWTVHGADTPLNAPGAHQQKTVLMQADTPLWFLGDVLPVPLLGKVYSLGDLVAGIGAFVLLARRTTHEA